MIFYFILGFSVVALAVGYKIRKSAQEIDRLLKTNQTLEAEKAVAKIQVKHFEVRKKNEENTRSSRRSDVIERLQQSGDLRD